MEIQYAIPCEACSVSKESTWLLDRNLTTVPKEPLAKLFAWAKIKQT
jgi:hypothetical protein